VRLRQLRPRSYWDPIQPVEQDPGGRGAADPQLVVVAVAAPQDLHAIGDQQAGPTVAAEPTR
jgi:hypothetical protein